MNRFGYHDSAGINRRHGHKRRDKGLLHRPCGESAFPKRSETALGIILSEARPGEYELIGFLCNKPAFRCRMMSLGLLPGTRIRILEGGRGRPFLVEIRGGRFMMDLRSAATIAIRQISTGAEGGER